MRIPTPSVRVRITLITTLVVGGALAAGSLALVNGVHESIESEIAASERTDLVNIANQLVAGRPLESIVLRTAPVGTIEILDEEGEIHHPIVEGTGWQRPPRGSFPGHGLEPGEAFDADDAAVKISGDEILTTVSVPVGTETVQVASVRSLAQVNATVKSIGNTMWFAVPLAVAFVAMLTWLLTGRALAPVANIRQEVESISRTTLHRRVPVPATRDEIARLATTMNSMLERLDNAATREQEFLSDASHELRSPVASIGATLEVALRNEANADWPDVARRALEDQARLGASVDALVTLSSLSEIAAAHTDASQTVDLDDIVMEVANRPARVPISVANVSAAQLQGRPDLLERLVRNLIHNAQRHANTRVDVHLRTDGDTVFFTVDDDGDGVAVEDRERIFDRFTRLDEGRSRDHGGTGLGLAMVRSIATRHGGVVTCTESPLGGARFSVQLAVDCRSGDTCADDVDRATDSE